MTISIQPVRRWLTYSVWLCSCVGVLGAAPAPVDFNREIRPILSEHCYACHGPDEGKRKAGLRLDVEQEAFKSLKSGERAIVAGEPSRSALVSRIHSTDPDEIMPPPDHGKPLSPAQVKLLAQWVTQGARWQQHWAFIPPQRGPLPQVKQKTWPRNPLDTFVLKRLEAGGLKPNPEADKSDLLRRLTFDLTGLPPTIEDVDSFLADASEGAYDKAVDRLMSSRHFGERMAQQWLDLARYADTSGYHFDGVRFMWLWRDWVIDSFNDNKPFDEFTIEQLAGDLLPKPTQNQRIATGFVRNNMTNDEGGADPQEYLNKYVTDRVTTLGSVWLGMTVGCAECHDHKYDPIKTKEFYQFYSFFHNVPEKGLDRIRTDNPPPRLAVPSPEQATRFVEAEFTFKDAEKTLQDKNSELGEVQERWERELSEQPPTKLKMTGILGEMTLNDSKTWTASSGKNEARQASTNALKFVDGRLGRALQLDGANHLEVDVKLALDRTNSFSYGAWINLQAPTGTVFSKMEKEPGFRGFDLILVDSRLNVHLVNTWPDNAVKVRTKDPLAQNQWAHVMVTYDGSSKAAGIRLYINGRSRELETEKDTLSGSLTNSEPLRIGARHTKSDFVGLISHVRFFDHSFSAAEVLTHTLEGYWPIISKSRGKRNDQERAEIARFYKENFAFDLVRAEAALVNARRDKDAIYASIPTTMIMEEMNPPRETFVLVRGDFRTKGEKVAPTTPAFLPPLPTGSTNRLSLARWLMTREHPLTARVTVNRFWATFFGTGLVKTVNDFGSQGEWPSHPELLDWLATQFRDGGSIDLRQVKNPRSKQNLVPAWDVKALVRLLVTSATYRQSGSVTPEKLEHDPYNRLLTRGPRLRLDAEFIRDNALAVAGLLNRKIGGPSIKPYQPSGIWDGVDATYTQDHGEPIYRRGMYVFWRRSAHYPSFATFDAPNREVCTFLRQRTQTPLQSLVMMNDPVYIEAARGLAQRVLAEEPSDLQKRLIKAFRHTLGRPPAASEIDVLRKTYEEQRANFQQDPKAAEAFLKVGELKLPEKMEPVDFAALAATASVLLNLNETITK